MGDRTRESGRPSVRRTAGSETRAEQRGGVREIGDGAGDLRSGGRRGLRPAPNRVLRGHVAWDRTTDSPVFVVDGGPLSLFDLGRILRSYEGWRGSFGSSTRPSEGPFKPASWGFRRAASVTGSDSANSGLFAF